MKKINKWLEYNFGDLKYLAIFFMLFGLFLLIILICKSLNY